MPPINRMRLAPYDRDLYDKLASWFKQVDCHTQRQDLWVKTVVDSFWVAGVRSYQDLAGFDREGVNTLPDPPKHAKAAFAWRAILAAENELNGTKSTANPNDSCLFAGDGSIPVLINGGSNQALYYILLCHIS